jgi:uncharacterized oligopeptide transporter (OPT) family protein
MITIGALIGVAIIAVDVYLKRRKAPFQAPVLAVRGGHLSAAGIVGADLRRRTDRLPSSKSDSA